MQAEKPEDTQGNGSGNESLREPKQAEISPSERYVVIPIFAYPAADGDPGGADWYSDSESSSSSESGGEPDEGEGRGEGRAAKPPRPPRHQQDLPASFTLAPGIPMVPAKLVAKVLRGDFVDMLEFLPDNLGQKWKRSRRSPGRREHEGDRGPMEIPDLMSWVKCYAIYMALVLRQYPQQASPMLGHMHNIVEGAKSFGGKGWLKYDVAFRQYAAGLGGPEKVDFGIIHQSIYASTFMAHRGGQTCQICQGPDHTALECTWSGRGPSQKRTPPQERRWKPQAAQQKGRKAGPCFAYNDGVCKYAANCHYEHVCSTCGGSDHRKGTCRPKGEDGERGRDPYPRAKYQPPAQYLPQARN